MGWTFDVRATALSGTSTRSLDGGVLFPAELTLARGEGTPPTSGARAWAGAEGSTFINPFLDPNKPSDSAQFREGRLIGGGIVKESRPMSLVLRQADYARASLIQRRINERFGQPVKVANAKSASVVELKIPRAYRQDYSRFLLLLMHLPLQAGPGRSEARAREIAREMLQPGANHDGLALVWEAMGSQVIPVCRTLYAHANLPAAFHAARTGLRLEDKLAGDVMMRMAETSGSPFQVASIEEMGRAAWMVRSIPVLRRLVDADNELVRIAAYDALVKLGDTSLITRLDIDGEFALYMVTSRRSYVIYATQSLQKRIVLFGRDMAVSRRLFFNMPNDLVTITNRIVDVDEEGDYVDLAKYKARGDQPPQTTKAERMVVFRSIARTGSISAPFFIDRSVRSLVATLGRRAQRGADGKIRGLELNYGQIVSVLYRMCEVDKDIPAKFVLQPAPATRRIYRDATSLGRPDMPGE